MSSTRARTRTRTRTRTHTRTRGSTDVTAGDVFDLVLLLEEEIREGNEAEHKRHHKRIRGCGDRTNGGGGEGMWANQM